MRDVTSVGSAVLRSRYLVLSTQYSVPVLAILAALAGCGSSPDAEPSFAHQLSLVKAGKSDMIQVESHPLTDADLASLTTAQSLRIFLIDNPQSRITAAGLKFLSPLPNLEHLRLRGPGIDDAALAELTKLKNLQILNLPQGQFTDEGLAQLKTLTQLVQLRFRSPHVTDQGMLALAEFPTLKRLHLIEVPITDNGLKTLAGIQQLESLYIDGNQFSDEAVDALFAARPTLHVHFNEHHHDRDPHAHP